MDNHDDAPEAYIDIYWYFRTMTDLWMLELC